MGILSRLLGKASQRSAASQGEVFPYAREPVPVWLPGEVEVQIAGESHHEDSILAAQLAAHPSGQLVGVLAPEPTNPYDQFAIAVHLNAYHVGYLHADVARRVQPALLEFARTHGSAVSCPAEIREHDIGFQVVLFLDCVPLGLSSAAFDVVPNMARELGRLLARLDTPPPALNGCNVASRAALTEAENEWAAVEDDRERDQDAWPRVERIFRDLVAPLTRSNDPLVSRAWLGVARSVRYQRGHRDEALAACVEALHYDRSNGDAWWELCDLASAAPHVPTLLAVFQRIPFASRKRTLRLLLIIADGGGRLGNITPDQGNRLRTGILQLIESQGDTLSTAFLAGQAGLRAERDGDIGAAVSEWKRAVAAGSTDGKVADRYSIWLTKHGQYGEAARVLRQALADPPQSDALRERMERRLSRCSRHLS